MTERQEKNLQDLQSRVQTLEDINQNLESLKAKHYDEVLSLKDVDRKLMYAKASLSLYEYILSKLGDEDHLKIGKYLEVHFWLNCGHVNCDLVFNDDITHRLYNEVFGSYSGINEFTKEHIPDMLSIICGVTNYSHALGSYDLNDVFRVFSSFGYYDKSKDTLQWRQEDFDEDVKRAKAAVDVLTDLSKKESVVKAFDNFLGAFFTEVFRERKEEE